MLLHRKRLMITLFFCLAFGAAQSLPAAEYVFPQVADGRSPGLAYVTGFLLNNVTDVQNTLKLSFYNGAAAGPANGSPWEIELLSHDRGTISGRRATHTIVLGPGETLNVFTAATNPINVGWARIQSIAPLDVSEVFSAVRPDLSPMRVAWEAGVLSHPATARFSFEANYSAGETVSGTLVDTGYAIANPNPESATITAVLYSRLGTEVSRRTIPIPSNGQIAEFMSERFGGVQLPEQFHGLLRISSDDNIAVCSLRMSSGSEGDVFSTVAVHPDLTLGYHPVNDREPSTGPGSAQAISVPAEITGSKNVLRQFLRRRLVRRGHAGWPDSIRGPDRGHHGIRLQRGHRHHGCRKERAQARRQLGERPERRRARLQDVYGRHLLHKPEKPHRQQHQRRRLPPVCSRPVAGPGA